MGFTPGLPPGIFPNSNNEIRNISNFFESEGYKNEYIQSPLEKEYEKKLVFIFNIPKDYNPEEITNFIVDQLIIRKLYSNSNLKPEIKMKLDGIEINKNFINFSILFPTITDAENALLIHSKLQYNSIQIDMRPFRKKFEEQINNFQIFEYHPTRIIVSNIDINLREEFPIFLSLFFQIDSFYLIKEFPDSCLFDISPPLTPESGSKMIDGKNFGNFQIRARPMRLNFSLKNYLYGKFQVLNDGIDLQQILNKKNQIIKGINYLEYQGKTLLILNVLPINLINDELESKILKHNIIEELKQFGKILSCTFSLNHLLGAIGDYGVIIIEFNEISSALLAQENISGRRYLGRTIITILKE